MKLGEKQEKTVSPEVSKIALDSNLIGRLLSSEMELSTNSDILGSIYKQLLISEKMELDDKKSMYDQLQKERKSEDSRNQEIILALTGRKRKKPKEEVEVKKETKKEVKEEKKVTEKPEKVEKAPKKEVKPLEKAPPKPPKEPVTKLPPVSIIAGAGVVTGLLAGKEALAANISRYESRGDYNAYNKGTSGNKIVAADKPIDFSKMTITEYLKRGALPSGDENKIFAMGKYQIIPETMKSLVKKLNIDPDVTVLDPATQDALFANGLIKNTRKKVEDYITGKSDDRDAAILQLAQEFASVGIPYDMKVGNKQLKKGDSYYSGIGGNKAHNPPEEVGAALDSDRKKNLKMNTPVTPPVESMPSVGVKIEQSSKQNTELKKSLNKTGGTTIVNNQVNTPTVGGESESSSDVSYDDRPLILKKAER